MYEAARLIHPFYPFYERFAAGKALSRKTSICNDPDEKRE